MPKVLASIVGSYPRPPSVARLYSRLKSRRLSPEEFEKGLWGKIRALIKLLGDSGIRVLTDGMFWWDDIFNPFIRYVEGVKVGGLVRFYDNNFFFRAPIVTGKLSFRNGGFLKRVERSISLVREVLGEDALFKQPLPGPLTLATNSFDEFYGDVTELTSAWGERVLKPVIKELSALGVNAVELHEPSLTWVKVRGRAVGAGIEVLKDLIEGSGTEVWVVTYFGNLGRLGSRLKDLREAVVGVDMFSSRGVFKIIREAGLRKISLGLVDSRNTLMEDEGLMVRRVNLAIKSGAELVYVSNNAPMDFIPEPVARRKIKLLSRLQKRFR